MTFDLVLLDPPWHYNFRGNLKTKFRGGACQHYGLMKPEELAALPVPQLGGKRAMFWIWGVCPKTQEALVPVLNAWELELSTLAFLWEKINADGSPWWGTGYYTAQNAEPLWLACRGLPRFHPEKRFNQVQRCPHPRDERGTIIHSRKPAIFHELIEAMYPTLRKVELFARRERAGWTCIGNGIDGRDIRESMADLIAAPEVAPPAGSNGRAKIALPQPTQAMLEI